MARKSKAAQQQAPAQQAAAPAVLLLGPAAPIAPPVAAVTAPPVDKPAESSTPAVEQPPATAVLTDEDCAAFMGVGVEPTPQSPLTHAECVAFMGVVIPAPEPKPSGPRPLTYEQRENPGHLNGPDLRALAHRRGIARSDAASMSDEKLRMQLQYIAYRRFEEEAA